jgi:NAD(P)-dependent dehydrogenase (short-subunit alcohol dehydrogenase family)
VVNDLGGSISGEGTDRAPADTVVAEIDAAGGNAIPDAHDVATPDGAGALVAGALDAFGRVDVLVNNAGIMRWATFPDVSPADLDRHLAVHVGGSFHTTRAVWPHLVARRYGRIVMTTSSGVFGRPDNVAYATAKAGVIGLARALATAGTPHDIRVNLVAPAAMTRMAGADHESPAMASELVAPMVAFLAHESCPVTGEIYEAGAGRFSRMFLASTEGWVRTDPAPTVEDVAAHWSEVNDESRFHVPSDLDAWSAAFTAHLAPERQS